MKVPASKAIKTACLWCSMLSLHHLPLLTITPLSLSSPHPNPATQPQATMQLSFVAIALALATAVSALPTDALVARQANCIAEDKTVDRELSLGLLSCRTYSRCSCPLPQASSSLTQATTTSRPLAVPLSMHAVVLTVTEASRSRLRAR